MYEDNIWFSFEDPCFRDHYEIEEAILQYRDYEEDENTYYERCKEIEC